MLVPFLLICVPILGACVMVLTATKLKRLGLIMLINTLVSAVAFPIGIRGWGILGFVYGHALILSAGSTLLTALILWHVRKRHPSWFE